MEPFTMTTIATEIDLEPLAEAPAGGPPLLESALPFLGAVKVAVSVRVGSAEMSVAELLETRQGAVLTLDRLVDQPLDVLVADHVVARGVLVAVGEWFGVRISETVSPSAGV
jgi:flagellar motor switch protein FliN/FliY